MHLSIMAALTGKITYFNGLSLVLLSHSPIVCDRLAAVLEQKMCQESEKVLWCVKKRVLHV